MNITAKLYCIIILFFYTIGVAKADIIINRAMSLQAQFVRNNEKYIISSEFDLNGKTLQIPPNCILFFKNGILSNGELIGLNTCIVAPKTKIFRNIKISGSWNSKIVYSEWVDLKEGIENDNKLKFKNLMSLCKGDIKKDVYIQSGNYWTSVDEFSCAFSIPSNTTMHCSATISELPNKFENACLISINKATNVSIDGGNYIGDLKTHIGDKGEWSHGIVIRGSSNVEIKNVKCSYFWGDGIDIIEGYNNKMEPVFICKNVVVFQSECLYNRRQGISIEAVEDCLIKQCIFSFTGRYKSTPPSAGIDIEAWASNSEKIKYVRIENCNMTDNVGVSFQSYANAVLGNNYTCYKNSIEVIDCIMDDIAISHTNGIEFRRCIIDKIKYEKKSQSVKFVECKIRINKHANSN